MTTIRRVQINLLVDAIVNGDRDAFTKLYQYYYSKVFRTAYYFIRNKEACKDVVIEVFYFIWHYRKKLDKIENMDSYIYTITKNEAHQYLKYHKNHTHIDDITIQLKEDDSLSPENKMMDGEIAALLTEVINELPRKCRIIFLMARQEGLKPKEIGEILSINESTVRVQIKIAIEKIVARIHHLFPNITFIFIFGLVLHL